MAGRPRTPLEKAEATGRTTINPGRYKDRAKPKVYPLGEPYKWMTEDERRIWAETAEEIPWLCSADRKMLGQVCRLWASVESGEAGISVWGQLRLCLSSLGATPTTRSRIFAPDEDDKSDPAAEFIN